METQFWNQFQTLLETALTIVLTAAIPVLGMYARQWLREQVGQKKLDTAVRLVRTAVMAAEQEGVDLDGEAKKQMAIDHAQRLLNEANIQLDVERLGAIIESVVYEEINRWQPLEAELEVVGG